MSNIKVAVRARPLSQAEIDNGDDSHWTIRGNSIFLDDKADIVHTFDRIFGPTQSNAEVYEEICRPIVESVMKGFNGTLFAYGQTASGKTHTMMGTDQQPGLIRLAVQEVFNIIENVPDREYLLQVSYLEIYKENLHDLLKAPSGTYFQSLQLRELNGQPYVQDLTEQTVCSMEGVMKVMKLGEKHRHIGCTDLNLRSSRSHTIFKMVIESRPRGREDDAVTVSHLNLVDLAGSERTAEAGTTGDRQREGNYINTSLMTLSQVISKLSRGEQGHINFRDSKLTRILQNSLGGNAHTAIVCTVTPSSVLQTTCTLRFASSAKKICNRPVVNEVVSDTTMMRRYHREIQELRRKMKAMEDGTLTKTLQEKDSTIESLSRQVEELQRQLVVSTHPLPPLVPAAPAPDWRSKRRETWGGSHPSSAPPVLTIQPLLPPLTALPSIDINLSTIEELSESATSGVQSSGTPEARTNVSFESIPVEQFKQDLRLEEKLRSIVPAQHEQTCSNKNCSERIQMLESELASLRQDHKELEELTTLEKLMCSTSHRVQPNDARKAAASLSPFSTGTDDGSPKPTLEGKATPEMCLAALQTLVAQNALRRHLLASFGGSPLLVTSSPTSASNFGDARAVEEQPELSDLMTFLHQVSTSDMDLDERPGSSLCVCVATRCSVETQTDGASPMEPAETEKRDNSTCTDRFGVRERGTSCELPLRSTVDACVQVVANVVSTGTCILFDGPYFSSDIAVETDVVSVLNVETMTDTLPPISVTEVGTLTNCEDSKTAESEGTMVSRSFFERDATTSPMTHELEDKETSVSRSSFERDVATSPFAPRLESKGTAVCRSTFEKDAATSPMVQRLGGDTTVETQRALRCPGNDVPRQTSTACVVGVCASSAIVTPSPAVIPSRDAEAVTGSLLGVASGSNTPHSLSESDSSQSINVEQLEFDAIRARFPFLKPNFVPRRTDNDPSSKVSVPRPVKPASHSATSSFPSTLSSAAPPVQTSLCSTAQSVFAASSSTSSGGSQKTSASGSNVHPDELARRLAARSRFPYLKPRDEPWGGPQPLSQPATSSASVQSAVRSGDAAKLPPYKPAAAPLVDQERPQCHSKPVPGQSTAVQTDQWSAQAMSRRVQSLEKDLEEIKKAHKRQVVKLEAEIRRLHKRELNSTILQPRPATPPRGASPSLALTAADMAAMTPRSREGARLLQYGRMLNTGGIIQEFRAERLEAQLKIRNDKYHNLERRLNDLISARKHCTCVAKRVRHTATSPLCAEPAAEKTVKLKPSRAQSRQILFRSGDEEYFKGNCETQ